MADPKFNLLLISRLSDLDKTQLGLTVAVMETIQDELMALFREVGRLSHTSTQIGIAWDLTEAEWALNKAENSALVYFLRDSTKSLTKKRHVNADLSNTAGFTFTPPGFGTVSEAYVEWNFPAKKLAHIAFHELMHNKLELGENMHQIGGGGLAVSPVTGTQTLTVRNAQLMAAALPKRVKQDYGFAF